MKRGEGKGEGRMRMETVVKMSECFYLDPAKFQKPRNKIKQDSTRCWDRNKIQERNNDIKHRHLMVIGRLRSPVSSADLPFLSTKWTSPWENGL